MSLSDMAKIRNVVTTGRVILSETERTALRSYLDQVGYRAGSRALGIARATATVAALGGTVRPGTACLLRVGLATLANSGIEQ
jgi:hypothetical protein